MAEALTPFTDGDEQTAVVDELTRILSSAHLVWGTPDERRRMRYFGFRPAVEAGVLKREWHGVTVRVSSDTLRAVWPGTGEVELRMPERSLLLDGRPFVPTAEGMAIAQHVLDLIQAYERWVEAREGKDERLSRGRVDGGRLVNPLAETRRFQRTMQVRRRAGR
ncbi:MAG: hypothetical protein KDC33_06350 [Thermoleophilia bacterium]|nr:hypothetical protein [Thermoleophilia bacterium]